MCSSNAEGRGQCEHGDTSTVSGQNKTTPHTTVHSGVSARQSRICRRPFVGCTSPQPKKRDSTDVSDSRPPNSTGYDHAGDGALWRGVAVSEKWKQPWSMWGRCVVDLRPKKGPMVAGRLLRHAVGEVRRVVNMATCERKIGMCRCPHERFMFYQASDAPWQPWLMCLLGSTRTRQGSWFLEASLILAIETSSLNIVDNINWALSCDYGGRGRKPTTKHVQNISSTWR